jgi:Uma2 family endonuclease
MTIHTAEVTTTELITAEQLLAMGNIGRCELVEGRIIMLSPTGGQHGIIEGRFYKALDAFVTPRHLGLVMVGEVGIYTRRHPDTVRGADALYISNERAAKWSGKGYLDVAPDLVVEVMSPDDRWIEITQKLREYFQIGVRLVWVAEPSARLVYAYRSLTDVRQLGENDTLSGDDVLPGFSVPVAGLFEE